MSGKRRGTLGDFGSQQMRDVVFNPKAIDVL